MGKAIALVKEIMELNKPVFGICLGHQLIALALGLQTFKMKNGVGQTITQHITKIIKHDNERNRTTS
jgi:carbamoylphosphate synthase small subunit